MIYYFRFTYDITHCMYSSGNITEKLRVASFDCRGETVIDLYAGNLCDLTSGYTIVGNPRFRKGGF